MTQERIKQEIVITLDNMQTATDAQREYCIGTLSARCGCKALRSVAFERAVAAWDKIRERMPAP